MSLTDQPPQPRKVLREAALFDFDGLQKSQRAKLISEGKYPAPFRMNESGRGKIWFEDEIAKWQEKRAATRMLKTRLPEQQQIGRQKLMPR
jgi:predicted DNA-binding transcriptional regulator AlpA